MELGAQKLFLILLYYLKEEPMHARKEAVTLPEKDETDFGDFEQTWSQLPKFRNIMDFQQSYISMVLRKLVNDASRFLNDKGTKAVAFLVWMDFIFSVSPLLLPWLMVLKGRSMKQFSSSILVVAHLMSRVLYL